MKSLSHILYIKAELIQMSSKICTKCLTNTKTYATHTEQKPRLKPGVLNPKDCDKCGVTITGGHYFKLSPQEYNEGVWKKGYTDMGMCEACFKELTTKRKYIEA